MQPVKNILPFVDLNGVDKQTENDEIIIDSAIIDCMNKLSELRENESNKNAHEELEVLSEISRISAEMRWFSQCLTAKTFVA